MRLFLVIPCYNEQEVLPLAAGVMEEKMNALIASGRIAPDSRVLLVDDGSRDGTWPLIVSLHQQNPLFSGLKLAHNVGHQNAVLAGLMTVRERCDAAVSMDADLQDDINAIDGFLDKYAEGCHVVYGVRRKRDADTAFKRRTALAFYRLMSRMGVETVYNHADYRLMSRQALEALAHYPERNLFLRGMVPLIGYKSDIVYYDRGERAAGESKYPLKKMFQFALQGITSFSVKPLRLIASVGGLIVLGSLIALLVALILGIAGVAGAGTTALLGSLWLLGGIQLLAIGVCGEYIGKIYSEVKGRPRYWVETWLGEEE
ncbi:MAG: glycosyltransferase family 2 protein [Acutalibacteraceae bacterium]|jgi:glycosyltransferase involved in cell wall biosynthesis